MQIKMSTIIRRVNELDKMNLKDNNIDFGRIHDGQTEYHQDVLDVRKKLNNFSRALSRKEKDYVSKTTKNMVLNMFVNNFVKPNHGDISKAIADFKQATRNEDTRNSIRNSGYKEDLNSKD